MASHVTSMNANNANTAPNGPSQRMPKPSVTKPPTADPKAIPILNDIELNEEARFKEPE
jgi:hypothetical protein